MSTSPISLFMAALWLALQINWSMRVGTGARYSYYDRPNAKRLSFHQDHPVNDANTRNSVFFVWDVCFHCLFSITASPCGFILIIRYDCGPASPCTYVCSEQILPHPGGSIWRREAVPEGCHSRAVWCAAFSLLKSIIQNENERRQAMYVRWWWGSPCVFYLYLALNVDINSFTFKTRKRCTGEAPWPKVMNLVGVLV